MKKNKAIPSVFTIEKKFVAQVRYYETLYLIHDPKGERVYTGSEEAAKRILAALNGEARKRGKPLALKKRAKSKTKRTKRS